MILGSWIEPDMLYVSRGVLWCFIACNCPPIGASPGLPLLCKRFILIKNCQYSITTTLKTENILEFNYALKQAFRELGPCIQCAECMWLSRFRLAWCSCYWWVCSYRSLPIFTIIGVMFFSFSFQCYINVILGSWMGQDMLYVSRGVVMFYIDGFIRVAVPCRWVHGGAVLAHIQFERYVPSTSVYISVPNVVYFSPVSLLFASRTRSMDRPVVTAAMWFMPLSFYKEQM